MNFLERKESAASVGAARLEAHIMFAGGVAVNVERPRIDEHSSRK